MNRHADTDASTKERRWVRTAVWLPGLAVAVGAAVATAHGLFEVALAARVPAGIAWIYPLITDGLALVAYAATARLSGSAARYAWAVVIVSAGLSGMAQASYLASDAVALGGGLAVAPTLRFGVGAWPAIAAAVVAHLLYLLAADHSDTPDGARVVPSGPRVPASVTVPSPGGTPPSRSDALNAGPRVPPVLDGPVIPGPSRPPSQPERDSGGPKLAGAAAPASDRARDAAERHRACHGALPTVRELQDLADVGRGTAARALAQLRDTPQQAASGLHLVTDEPTDRTRP